MQSDISREIWNLKYKYTNGDKVCDQTIEDTWKRVSKAVAQPEKEKERNKWTAQFYSILEDFKFLPGGRILANAGTTRSKTTMFNCYVMNTVKDSIDGIFDVVKESALTQKQGGGVGYDFSSIRPKGDYIKGVESEASGPISFMRVMDATCRTIMSAGQRRGAQMGVMRCDHPDIEDFIIAKRQKKTFQMFNLSVAITDDFIEAVKNDAAWNLIFKGNIHKTVQAKDLWDKIMNSTYDYAEPGVIMIDEVNKMNNLHYCETISATNPCVTKTTWVHTDNGPRQVKELIGKAFSARVNGEDYLSGTQGFFNTGEKDVLTLKTSEGYEIELTADHPVRKAEKLTRYSTKTSWCNAGQLKVNDLIVLNNHAPNISWDGKYSHKEGYLIGMLLGDGTIKKDKAILSVWKMPLAANGEGMKVSCGTSSVMKHVLECVEELPKRSDFVGWQEVHGRNEYRLSLSAIKNLAHNLGIFPGKKKISTELEKCSSDFSKGFLRGFFDADGSVQGSQEKGVSIRLSQSDISCLSALQRILLRLGIVSRIYRNRRIAGERFFPNGKGGQKKYKTKAQHELVISGSNLQLFSEIIGFADTNKKIRLENLLGDYKRELNRECFTAKVTDITPEGKQDVYDVQIPGINAFDANGLLVHNCGEQPLPPYGACLLGSVNLSKFINNPFTDTASIDYDGICKTVRVAVRFLDNIIQISNFPLQEQKEEAEKKRRMGLGITGLADAIIFLKLKYGSPEAIEATEEIMKKITYTAYETSIQLASEKGAFPLFNAEEYSKSLFIKRLPKELQENIKEYGIRNSHLTSIAPTGTISLLANNVSSGIEPVFAYSYSRKIKTGLEQDDQHKTAKIMDYAYKEYLNFSDDIVEGPNDLPDYFITTDDISPKVHIDVQSSIQQYVDSSISKTINVPKNFSFEDFKHIYIYAHEKNVKGCTTFRPNDKITGILMRDDEKKEIETLEAEFPERPSCLRGTTYKIKTPLSPEALYLTINDIEEKDGTIRPYELFINTKNLQHFSWIVAMTRLISALFRKEKDPSFLVGELKSIYDPNGGYFSDGQYIPSLAADIGNTIETHLVSIGVILSKEENATRKKGSEKYALCPECNEFSLSNQENCLKCLNCGYSKCG